MFGLPNVLEHLFSYNATLYSPREVIGPVAEGLRLNAFVTGGKVDGPRLRGIVRPGSGADWLTIRTDGIAVLDVRGTIDTHDGGLIYRACRGLSDFGPDGYARALKGELVPDGTPIRTTPTFQRESSASQVLRGVRRSVGTDVPIMRHRALGDREVLS
jgi:hypothetical protein